MPVAALVLGIVGIVFSWIPFIGIIGVIAGIIAVVLGAVSLKKPEQRGLSITGLVLGSLAVIIGLLWTIVATAFVGVGLNAASNAFKDLNISPEDLKRAGEEALKALQSSKP